MPDERLKEFENRRNDILNKEYMINCDSERITAILFYTIITVVFTIFTIKPAYQVYNEPIYTCKPFITVNTDEKYIKYDMYLDATKNHYTNVHFDDTNKEDKLNYYLSLNDTEFTCCVKNGKISKMCPVVEKRILPFILCGICVLMLNVIYFCKYKLKSEKLRELEIEKMAYMKKMEV